PRPGTKGHELYADDVPEEVKKRRNNDLLAIQNAVSLADHRRQIGQTALVLVEGPSKHGHAATGGLLQLTGRTPTDHIVVFDGHPRLTGHTVRVTIDEATSFTLFGTVETTEQIGAAEAEGEGCCETAAEPAAPARIGLPLV